MTMGEIPATYEIHAEEKASQARVGTGTMALIIGSVMIALCAVLVAVAGQLHANKVNAEQSAQIHMLNLDNSRMASELSAQNSALNQVSDVLAKNGPASSFVTCSDLRRLRLTVTTGASIEAGGSVAVSTSPVALPPHCR
jgi:hypothetical protein